MTRHLALALLLLALPAHAADGLEGTEWTMKLDGLAGWVTHSDRIGYADGKFSSEQCRKEGFAPTAYRVTVEGASLRWTATEEDGRGDTVQWDGLVDGDRMTGTLVWTRSGKVHRYGWSAVRAR